MGLRKQIVRQLGSMRRDRVRSAELEKEFSFHIDMEASRLMSEGLSESEARRRAVLSFGGADRYEEEMRDGWARRWVGDLVSDVRFALRSLARTPVFTVTAVATLALGLGGAAAVFTALQRVLLAPLPYANEERLVRIMQQNSPTNRFGLSDADFLGIQEMQHSFESVAMARRSEMALGGGAQPEWIRAGKVTAGWFATLGVSAARGRVFAASDTAPTAGPVVVISDDLAKRRFGSADPVGRTLVLDRSVYTVIGVLPAGLRGLSGIVADAWPMMRVGTPDRRGPFGGFGIAALKPGVSVAAATSDLASISEKLFPIWASGFQDRQAKLTPFVLRTELLGSASKSMRVLVVAVALVLLIALANVTNLVLVRATSRRREIALRVALGAGRTRLSRLRLTENIVLSLLGGVFAILVAAGAVKALVTFGPALPRTDTIVLDGRTVLFTMALAIAAGTLIALYPLVFTSIEGVAVALRSGDRRVSASRGARTFQDVLVIAEFALALPLLAGAALLLHSFMSLERVDPGFDPTNVAAIRVSLPSSQYPSPTEREQFWNDVLRETAAVPGVVAAGITSSLPPDNFGDVNNFNLVDHPVAQGAAEPMSPWVAVTPGYFKALGLRLLEGRMLDEHDDANAPPVIVVSRSWAKKYFPGESPLGRQLVSGGCYECPRTTIVGVVSDAKYSGLAGDGEGVYTTYSQAGLPTMQLVVKTGGPSASLLAAVRTRIHAVDPELPLVDSHTMTELLGNAVQEPRHWTILLGGFAVIAVMLAALGVFGVMSYIVSQQQRELGVRMALGAAPSAVVALIVKRGLKLAVAGTLLGLVAATQGTRVLEHVLYDVGARDPSTFGVVAAVLIMIATLACYLPGRRAAAVDPVKVISGD
jgi:predicted permease